MPSSQVLYSARCMYCGKRVERTRSGALRVHGPRHKRCIGSGHGRTYQTVGSWACSCGAQKVGPIVGVGTAFAACEYCDEAAEILPLAPSENLGDGSV